MRIEVTQADIEFGEVGHAEACPVALALERTTGRRWVVGDDELEDRKFGIIDSPSAVAAFVRAFDAGRPVAPFTFDLEV